jgi:hypothetical protein
MLCMTMLLVCITGCERSGVVDVPTVERHFPVDPDLDVLFVIDNSASTLDKQALFAQNFPALAGRLDGYQTGRPNLHIGVVSTTVGTGSSVDMGSACPTQAPHDDGLLQNTPRVPGCSGPTDLYISDVRDGHGGRMTNYSGGLPDVFTCIAELGAMGCGIEQPLEAMKRALDGSRPENAGFLRQDADLAVVILTDEDDASVADPSLFSLNNVGPGDFRAQPLYAYDCDQPISVTNPGDYTNCQVHHDGYLANPGAYVDFLENLKEPQQLMVALIAGDPNTTIHTGPVTVPFMQTLTLQPSCTTMISSNLAIARPANRLNEFRQAFGEEGVFETVCQSDYSNALADVGNSMLTMMTPCLDVTTDLTDRDAANPGVQPQCAIGDQGGPAFPACAMIDPMTPDPAGARPCWWLASMSQCGSGYAVRVERAVPAATGSVLDTVCAANR